MANSRISCASFFFFFSTIFLVTTELEMHYVGFIFRMDPNSCFLLEIKLVENRKKERKDVQCFSFE